MYVINAMIFLILSDPISTWLQFSSLLVTSSHMNGVFVVSKQVTTGFYMAKLNEIGYQVC